MPQIPYKDTQTVVLPKPNPAAVISVEIPNSQLYLGFTVQIIDALCDNGGDQGFNVEVSLGKKANGDQAWGLLYSADFYSAPDPHIHAGQAITFSLRAPAAGKLRLTSRANMTTAGTAIVSMYDRAFPPQV